MSLEQPDSTEDVESIAKEQADAPSAIVCEGMTLVEPEQMQLLQVDEWWKEHWQGMPEFVQEDKMPFKTIYVHLENRADLAAFAALTGQRLTLDTESIWYPAHQINKTLHKRWVDES